MTELIKITEMDGRQVVSARELHSFLEVKKHFTDWAKDQLEWFAFNVDYQAVHLQVNASNGIGGTTKVDYALTIDAAKEIAMMSKVAKGKQARQYFIECERRLKHLAAPTPKQLAYAILQLEEDKERMAKVIDSQADEIKYAAPKVQYCNTVLQSSDTYNTNLIAKELGMSAVTLNRELEKRKIQYHQGGTWILYHAYQNKGYTKTKTHTFQGIDGTVKSSMQTVWTEAGRKFIHETMNTSLIKTNPH